MYRPIISASKNGNMYVNIVDQSYLLKLYATLEKVKQAQLGLDNESRIEYRNLEKALVKKIKEVQATLRKPLKETMV
jgi:hypothetical protein